MMYLFCFLCGVAAALIVVAVVMLIAFADEIRERDEEKYIAAEATASSFLLQVGGVPDCISEVLHYGHNDWREAYG